MKALHRELAKLYLVVAILDLVVALEGYQDGQRVLPTLMAVFAAVAVWASFGHWVQGGQL